MDCGAEEPTEHVLLPPRAGGISLVCAQAPTGSVCPGRVALCFGLDGKATGHHLAVRPFAVGLLAAPADRGRGWIGGSGIARALFHQELLWTGDREDSSFCAVRRQRPGDHGSSTGWRSEEHTSELQSLRHLV